MNVTLIAVFLFFVCITLSVNTVLIWVAYKGVAGYAAKFTEAAQEFERSGVTREWIASLDKTVAQAASLTETAKRKLIEADPALVNLQARYQFALAKIDTKVEWFADTISDGAQRVSDAVIGPVGDISAFTSGIQAAIEAIAVGSDRGDRKDQAQPSQVDLGG